MANNKKEINASGEEIITIETNKSTNDGPVFGDKKRKGKKPKKMYQKSTFKHKMKVLGVLSLLGVFTGSGLGVWYFNTALKSNVDYGSLVYTDYVGNVDDAFTALGVANADGWAQTAKNAGKSPQSLNPINNILLAEYKASQAQSYEIVGTGKVFTLGIAQSVYSEKKFDGDTYSFVSISAGMLTVATCDVMNKGGNTVTVYQGQNPTADGATWVSPENMTNANFEAMNGVMPNTISPYLISDKTVEQMSEVTLDSETGLYSFTVKLKPVESVLLYYKQVQRSGGLEANPEFYSIEITYQIDDSWNLVSTEVVESYKAVKFGMPVTCDGTLLNTYKFDGEVTLPV